jgi:hypothetical protein
MPCRSDEDDIQLPSDPNYITPPTDRRKCGAQRFSFSCEGSISVPSPVTEKKIEKQGRAQEQNTLSAAHVMAIRYRPALRYPFSGVGSNTTGPSPGGKSDQIHLFVFLFCFIAHLKVVFDILSKDVIRYPLLLLLTCLPCVGSNNNAVSFVRNAKNISADSYFA